VGRIRNKVFIQLRRCLWAKRRSNSYVVLDHQSGPFAFQLPDFRWSRRQGFALCQGRACFFSIMADDQLRACLLLLEFGIETVCGIAQAIELLMLKVGAAKRFGEFVRMPASDALASLSSSFTQARK
jgi:hypothetical protein